MNNDENKIIDSSELKNLDAPNEEEKIEQVEISDENKMERYTAAT